MSPKKVFEKINVEIDLNSYRTQEGPFLNRKADLTTKLLARKLKGDI
jgi:hypothetical protein